MITIEESKTNNISSQSDNFILQRNNNIIAIAESNIGKLREKNEDFYGLFINDEDPNLILIAVADGLGGLHGSERASRYTIKKLGHFFEKSNPEDINHPNRYKLYLDRKIREINKTLPVGGTTLTGAILGKENLIIFNIGDSRTYGFKNNKLIQLTEDDSKVWEIYKQGLVKKDDIRFIYGNNIMTEAIDGLPWSIHPRYKIVNKNQYDALLLTSDGIHDILSDKTMEDIIINNINDPQMIINRIIDISVNGPADEISEESMEDIYAIGDIPFSKTQPGKDNATGMFVLTKKIGGIRWLFKLL